MTTFDSSKVAVSFVAFATELAKHGVHLQSITIDRAAYDALVAGLTLPPDMKVKATQDKVLKFTHSGGSIDIRWET